MRALFIALMAALFLSACAPKGPVVGEAGCDVWNDTKGSLTGRAVEAEYAAGFFDGYAVGRSMRETRYGWIIDSINAECERDPSSSIQKAAERAVKRFEE